MSEVQEFTVAVPQETLDELQAKLSATKFPDELEDSAWDRGAPLADVKRLTEYWRNGFDWRKVEGEINKLPNFRTHIQVDGFDAIGIHFLHQQSTVANAIPLLFVHGWPGNFLEVSKLLPLLGAGDGKKTPAFHIVAPSLPNYVFSDGVSKRGFGLAQYAEAFDKLMQKLGYTEYVTQGGDWGSMITRSMARLFPQRVKAQHLNLHYVTEPPKFKNAPVQNIMHRFTSYTSADIAGLERTKWFGTEGIGYNRTQSTKPQTIGYALNDSPVALLAWIYEKLVDWTDNYAWTDEEIITWIMLYWISKAGPAASVRIYYEATHKNPQGLPFVHRNETGTYYASGVPFGFARFPRELQVVPKSWLYNIGPLVHFSDNERGGHFAATEQPAVIARDLTQMLQRGGPCYGVVKGRSGYEHRAKL